MAYMRMHAVEKAVEKATGKSPCMGCTDRVLGCSADCEKYKEWRHFLLLPQSCLPLSQGLNAYPWIRLSICGLRGVCPSLLMM